MYPDKLILILGKSDKEEVYPDLKILSRELRKVSREAKQETKKAESNRKSSKKMLKPLNKKFHAFKIETILFLQGHYKFYKGLLHMITSLFPVLSTLCV